MRLHGGLACAFVALVGLLWVTAANAVRPDYRNLAYGPASDQVLDVYLPAKSSPQSPSSPILLMVHGGGWKRGDKAMTGVVSAKLGYWQPRGVILVSSNYRMLPEAPPHEQVEDIARALAFVQQNAARWGGDATRVVLMGHSAGAHLVALLGAQSALQTRHGALPPRAIVSLDSGALDLPAIMRGPHFRLYDDAFGNDPAYWQRMSPLHQLQEAPPPYLVVCSSKRVLPCPEGERFAQRVKTLGGIAEVLPQRLSHGEINAQLGLPGEYTDAVDRFLTSVWAR